LREKVPRGIEAYKPRNFFSREEVNRMNTDTLTLLLGLSFVIQVVVDLIKGWMQSLPLPENFHKYTAIVVSLAAGVVVAYETDVGLLAALGVSVKDTWVDIIFTGLMLAGGSNIINQIIEYLRTLRKTNGTGSSN